MFELVVLRRNDGGRPLSAGLLAEKLLFYRRVHLILDRASLLQLVRQVGTTQLLAVIEERLVTAVYVEEMLCTLTSTEHSVSFHSFEAVTLAGSKETGPLKSIHERIEFDLATLGVAKSEAKAFSRAFGRLVPVTKLSGRTFCELGIHKDANALLVDGTLVNELFRSWLKSIGFVQDRHGEASIELLGGVDGWAAFTGVDWVSLNQERATAPGSGDPMQVANFLSAVLDSHADLVLSAHYGGDFVTSAEASSLVQLRNRFALKSTQRSKSEQLNFVELTLPNMPTVAEAIDGGEVSFSKFMEMLSRSRRFKSWLHGLNPDKGLVREYLDASIAPDWIETKTAKVIRYTLGIAAEALDSRLGSAVGLADSFLLDKLATGWRPNHFIDKHLRPLVSGEVA